MKTKQLFRAAMVVICAVVLTSVMTGCDDKNKPSDQQQQQDNKAVAAIMDYKFITSDDLLKIFDVKVEFYNDGKIETETVTTAEWTKAAKGSLPTKLGFRVKITPKEGIDYESFGMSQLVTRFNYSGSAVNAKGEKIGPKQFSEAGTEANFAGKKIEAWYNALPEYVVDVLYSYDAEGAAAIAQWQ